MRFHNIERKILVALLLKNLVSGNQSTLRRADDYVEFEGLNLCDDADDGKAIQFQKTMCLFDGTVPPAKTLFDGIVYLQLKYYSMVQYTINARGISKYMRNRTKIFLTILSPGTGGIR